LPPIEENADLCELSAFVVVALLPPDSLVNDYFSTLRALALSFEGMDLLFLCNMLVGLIV